MADYPPLRNRAFVSYSHADAEHLTRLHVHLAPYTREHKVDVWDDTRITLGARWKEDIKQAMNSAKVAILLVSADFMASEFIAHDELPPLLEAAEQEGTLIVPVILSPSSFPSSKLARYQSLNPPSDPLIDMPSGKQEAIWAKLAKYVADALAPAPADSKPRQAPLLRTVFQEEQKKSPALSSQRARPKVFVSHSHKNDDFTVRLVADLRTAGVEVWVDMVDMQHGDFMMRINEALSASEWLVLVLTPDALISPAVQTEVNAAVNMVWSKELKGVIPFMALPCEAKSIPPMWKNLHRYDATANHEQALAGLLRALGLEKS